MFLSRICLVALLLSTAGCKNNKVIRDLPAPEPSGGVETEIVEAGEPGLRLATYNVGVFGKSGYNTTEMVASMIKELGVQALSMNELDSCSTRNPSYQIKFFAEAMGNWGYNFSPAMPYQGGAYGIGIAYSPDLKLIREYDVALAKGDGSEPRALSVCEFQDYVFCSTHLDHKSTAAQLAQAQQICDWIADHYGSSQKPVILCGDFNALPNSETLSLMKKEWAVISPTAFTYPAKDPIKCIDYIMVYKNAASRVKVLSSKVWATFSNGDVKVASDHLPVYVRIEFQ